MRSSLISKSFLTFIYTSNLTLTYTILEFKICCKIVFTTLNLCKLKYVCKLESKS